MADYRLKKIEPCIVKLQVWIEKIFIHEQTNESIKFST